MYGKIFDSIYKGTLYGQWEAIVTLQQLVTLCDSQGVIDMTPQAIAATTSIPLNIINKGLKVLQDPDPFSRTPGEEGRRIVLIDDHRPWGWFIVNHKKYRDMASYEEKKLADKIRIAEKRKAAKNEVVASCRKLSQTVEKVANVAYTNADTNADTNTDTDLKTLEQAFKSFWSTYPKKRNIEQARKAWKKLNPDSELQQIIISAVEEAKQSEDWRKEKGQYIPYPSSWINAKGWLDEYDVSVTPLKPKSTGKLARAAQAIEDYHAEKDNSGTTLQDAGASVGLFPGGRRITTGD